MDRLFRIGLTWHARNAHVTLNQAMTNEYLDTRGLLHGWSWDGAGRMSRCKLCTGAVTDVKERRSLASKTSDIIRLVLQEAFILYGCVHDDVKEYCSSDYLCKKCFVLLEKRARLQRELQSVDESIQTNISVSVTAFSLRRVSPVATTVATLSSDERSATKRPAASVPAPAKKLCLSGPTPGSEPVMVRLVAGRYIYLSECSYIHLFGIIHLFVHRRSLLDTTSLNSMYLLLHDVHLERHLVVHANRPLRGMLTEIVL